MIGIKEVGIKNVIKIRNATLVLVYDDETGLISIDSGDLGEINCDVGGCINGNVLGGINGDVLVGINGNVFGGVSGDVDDNVIDVIDNKSRVVDNLEGDDDGNIRHGVKGNLPGEVMK